jgi:SOS response regulatory protein OraA/RecX
MGGIAFTPPQLPGQGPPSFCDFSPIFCTPATITPFTGGTPPAGSTSAIVVNVNNQINIANDGIQALADAVTSSLQASAQTAADIASKSANLIGDTMKSLGQTIFDGVKAALGALGDSLSNLVSGIGGFLKDLFKTLLDNIGTILKDIRDTIVPLIQKIADVVDAVAKQIQTINDTLIVPIANTVNGIIKTITTLTAAIETDLHEGLQGILRIPSDIANGLGSLDATLQRTVQQLGSINQQAVTVGMKDANRETVQAPLDNINKTLTVPPSGKPIATTYTDTVKLTEPAGAAQIEQALKGFLDFLGVDKTTGHFSLGEAFKNTLNAYTDAPGLFQWAFRLVMDGAMFLTELGAMVGPLEELAAEVARKQLPVTKLSVGDAIESWRRGLIDGASLKDELDRLGYNDSRQQAMRDLTVFIAPVDVAVNWFRRGFIGEDDAIKNMQQHGMDDAQIAVMLEDASRIIPVEQAVALWRRSLIDTGSLSRVLKENRFSDIEIDAFVQTFELQPDPQTVLMGNNNRIAFGELNFAATFNSTPSPELATAGKIAGWSDNQLRQFWWAHWNMPPLAQWINLYFRGVRTKTEVYAAMDAARVPIELRDDIIDAFRPLVPFRSIPSMLKAGVINEPTARKYLEAHGFDEATVLQLLAFANSKTTAATATTAANLHAASLSVGEELFSVGAITEQQYRELLAEHGFTAEAVDLTVKAQSIKLLASNRKATAQAIVDEASTGMITSEDAQQQLAQNNFTVAEIAHYVRQIRSAKVKASKIPGEAELNHMLQKSIIEEQLYVDALTQSGYSLDWASRFLALRTAATPTGG